jgi:O-antigen/teichoic acid export membrane protein
VLFSKLVNKLTGFAALHALNTGLNLVYTLLQLLVLARTLDPERYTQIVLLLSFGIYFQPVDQAIGRASYIVLRKNYVSRAASRGVHVITSVDFVYSALLAVACFTVPLLVAPHGHREYFESSLLLVGSLFTNTWSYRTQSIAWAVGLERYFSVLSLWRRLAHMAALALLWLSQDLLAFCIAVALCIFVFQIIAVVTVARSSTLFRPSSLVHWRWHELVNYVGRVANSLLSSLSELLVLNSPYLLIPFFYGVSPLIVVYDSVMKVARLSITGTRAFVETQLPKLSQLLIIGAIGAVESLALRLVVICFMGAALLAVFVVFKGSLLFSLLLGPNNLITPDLLAPAAAIILVTSIYQPIVVMLSYGEFPRTIAKFSLLCASGFLIFGLVVWAYHDGSNHIMWLYSAYCLICFVAGSLLYLRILRTPVNLR